MRGEALTWIRSNRAIRLAVVLASFALAQDAAMAQIGGLEPVLGDWRGRGTAREYPGGAPEAVLCRASNSAEGRRITSNATCNAASGRMLLSTNVRFESGRFSGAYQRTLLARDTRDRGVITGFRVRDGSFRFELASNIARSVLTLTVEGRTAYTLGVADAESGEVLLNIRFTR